MLILTISEDKEKHLAIKKRMEEMSLAKVIKLNNLLNEPVLIEGADRYEGEVQINQFLEKMAEFIEKWYECRCDKYDDL